MGLREFLASHLQYCFLYFCIASSSLVFLGDFGEEALDLCLREGPERGVLL